MTEVALIGIHPLVAIALAVLMLLAIAAFGKVLLAVYDARAIERHQQLERALQQEAQRLTVLQTRVDALLHTLPLEYVRREDWIRFSSLIDSKLDRVVAELGKLKDGHERNRS
jgi:hypothetical protein